RDVFPRRRMVAVWDMPARKLTQTLEDDSLRHIFSIAFTPDGQTLAAGGKAADGSPTLLLWNLATSKVVKTFVGHTSPVQVLAFSPDGKLLAAGGGESSPSIVTELKIWDVPTGMNVTTLKGHSFQVTDISFSPDGKNLASASGDQYLHRGEVKLWEVSTFKVLCTLTSHNDLVSSVAFSPDGSILATGSHDHTIKLWDMDAFLGKKP